MYRFRTLFVALAAVALVAAGCGDDDEDVTDQATDVVEDDTTTTEADGTDTTEPPDTETDTPTEGQDILVFDADLQPLNGSEDLGAATLRLEGNQLTVRVNSTEMSPGLPHAQHLHIGGSNECPGDDASGDDDIITTAEGIPSYGEVRVALTTEGDVSAESALAVERFPVAEDNGELSYERTFDLPSDVTADDLRNAVVVQHGFSELSGDPAKYDGDQKSSLDPSLPLEATVPALCGALEETG